MRSIFLGTDWWTDCDDAIALRIITGFVKRGDVRLTGICINACMEYSVASLRGFLSADGVGDVPIGIDLDATDYGGSPSYQRRLADDYGKGVENTDAENGVRLYRRILANSEDKIEMLEIGFLQVVAALLKSEADDISDKSGIELVREKVSKIWVMAGKWDADGERENNFCRNSRSRVAADEFCRLCPVPVTFLGWEIGYDVITGGFLSEDDHLHRVLCDHGSKSGRCSWDPMLALLALTGDENAAGYDTVTGRASVDAESGANYFKKDPRGNHRFVIKKHPNKYYEDEINRLIGTG